MFMAPRNKFAFPAGIAPGFDAAHPAAGGKLVLSAVAAGNTFVSPYNGAAGTINSTPSALLSQSGPQVSFASAAAGAISFTTASVQISTVAAVFTFASNQTNNGFIFQSAGLGIGITAPSTLRVLSGTNTLLNGPTLSVGHTYFIAVSALSATVVDYVLVDLGTGSIQSGSSSTATVLALSGTTVYIGNSSAFNRNLTGSIGAVAVIAGSYIGLPGLLQWAQDPWSFWYPNARRTVDQFFVGASSGLVYTLSAAEGIYSLSGKPQMPNSARSITASEGAYSLSGQAQTLNRGIHISPTFGAYSLIGEPQAFAIGMPAAQGSYSLAGEAQGLARGRLIQPASGSYTLNGKPQSFAVGLSLRPVSGAYALTGEAQVLAYSPASGSSALHDSPFVFGAASRLMGH